MRPARTLGIVAVAALSLALGALPAMGTTRITGTLKGGKGFTVVGVPVNGVGPSVRIGASGRFVLVFRGAMGRNATLQIIRPQGRYFGPAVLARSGTTAYTRLSGRSGSIGTLVRRAGYASPQAPVRATLVQRAKGARATRAGKPVGAGRLGYGGAATIKATRTLPVARQAPPQSEPLGADPDTDGLPNAIDVDANGNGILDTVDPAAPPIQNRLAWTSLSLRTAYPDSLNANAAGVADAQIDALLTANLVARFTLNPINVQPALVTSGVDVDCGQLVWCRPGTGTSVIFASPDPNQVPPAGTPWSAYDTDGSGLPNLNPPTAPGTTGPGSGWEIAVKPSVGRAAMSPADSMNFQARTANGTVTYASTLGPYFITVPAIKTIGTTTLEYPGTAASVGASDTNPVVLPDGTVTISFWRPQRAAIPGAEPPGLIDMGGLNYVIHPPGITGSGGCTNDEVRRDSAGLSTGTDGYYQFFTDTSVDGPPNGSTITVTVDLAACLRRLGVDPAQCARMSLDTEMRNASLASQTVWVRMPGATCRQLPPAGPGA